MAERDHDLLTLIYSRPLSEKVRREQVGKLVVQILDQVISTDLVDRKQAIERLGKRYRLSANDS